MDNEYLVLTSPLDECVLVPRNKVILIEPISNHKLFNTKIYMDMPGDVLTFNVKETTAEIADMLGLVKS